MAENLEVPMTSADGHEGMIDGDTFKIHLLESLGDEAIANKLHSIFAPSLDKLTKAINDLVQTNQHLKQQLIQKDATIAQLQTRCEDLEGKLDDMEQWTRRGSMRIQGLSEEGSGQVEDKILALCNTHLKIQPPLQLSEIEVAHRLPRPSGRAASRPHQASCPPSTPAEPSDASTMTTQSPRMVIVKFVSRRDKTRVMDLRKELKNLDPDIYQLPVYFQDDLTARRAKMAYQARKCRNDKKILDTWVIDSKIMVKDLHNRIHQIRSPKDMERFTNA